MVCFKIKKDMVCFLIWRPDYLKSKTDISTAANPSFEEKEEYYIEEYLLTKYGDILGSKYKYYLARYYQDFLQICNSLCCDFEGPNPVGYRL